MKKARRVGPRQPLETNEISGEANGGRCIDMSQGSGLAELSAVSQHRECLREGQRPGIEAAKPARHAFFDAFTSMSGKLARVEFGSIEILEFHRSQQFDEVERVA